MKFRLNLLTKIRMNLMTVVQKNTMKFKIKTKLIIHFKFNDNNINS